MRIAGIVVAAALTVAGVAYVGTRGQQPAPPKDDRTLVVDSSALKRTVVVATDRARMPEGKNVLWCASFQLAWDAFRRDLLGGAPVRLAPPAPPAEVLALNAEPFPPGDLDPSAFLAMAGRGGDGIAGRFANAAQEMLKQAPSVPSLGPDDVAAFALLVKDLPFEHPFVDYGALPFQGKDVRAFGLPAQSGNPDKRAILDQVRIHLADAPVGHARPEQLVLELAVRGGRDRLLLARIDPAPTLRETWEKVREAAKGEGAAPDPHTVLAIPKMRFDLTHRFAELKGPRALVEALQRTRFSLDEAGARVFSMAEVAAQKSVSTTFLFDGPFLVALVQKDATRPYLLLWIANDELLTPA
jgi:hypothetical protein